MPIIESCTAEEDYYTHMYVGETHIYSVNKIFARKYFVDAVSNTYGKYRTDCVAEFKQDIIRPIRRCAD